VSPYTVAINKTRSTIDSRAAHFRNLVVAVVIVSLGSFASAAITRTLPPLAAMLLLVPGCGVFLFLDAQLLGDWRTCLLAAWVRKDIDFCALRNTLNAVPRLPKETLGGMLAMLPFPPDLVAEQQLSPSTREAVAACVEGVHAIQSDAIVLKAVAASIVSGAVAIALTSRRWEPLLGGMFCLLLPRTGRWLKRRRLGALLWGTRAASVKPGFSHRKYSELVANLVDAPSDLTPPQHKPTAHSATITTQDVSTTGDHHG
jgi:hypothetical protein